MPPAPRCAEVAVQYGMFIQTLIDFLIIAFVIFLVVKAYNRMRKPRPKCAGRAAGRRAAAARDPRLAEALTRAPVRLRLARRRVCRTRDLFARSERSRGLLSSRLLFCRSGVRHASCAVAARLSARRHARLPPRNSDTRIPDAALATAAQLRERALADDTGWKVVESLTTEVGPRLAGSEADARAVAWAEAKFKQLGFDKVWTEPVTFPKWERRSEHGAGARRACAAAVLTALGGSPGGTVEAEVVRFADLAALQAAPAGSLAGKIAFVDYRMQRVPRRPRLRHRRRHPQQRPVGGDPRRRERPS